MFVPWENIGSFFLLLKMMRLMTLLLNLSCGFIVSSLSCGENVGGWNECTDDQNDVL